MQKNNFLMQFDASRIYIFSGLLLLITGMLLGEIYAIFIAHVANGIIKQNWLAIIEAISLNDTQSINDLFATISDLTNKRGRIMNTHSHIGAFGFLALILGFLQPISMLEWSTKRFIALLFIVGALLQFGFVYLSYYFGSWLLYFSELGGVLIVVSVVGTFLGLIRNENVSPTLRELVKLRVHQVTSRFLLRAGMLLIIIGMIFGLYHAWGLAAGNEEAVYVTLSDSLEHLSTGETEAAKQDFAKFKKQQFRNAIQTAAHSHAIEMGILMLLLALIQSYIFLRESQTLFWARMISVGAYMLPVCILLSSIYGFPFPVFADIAGVLVILGLFAMSVGVIRYTAVKDQQAEESL